MVVPPLMTPLSDAVPPALLLVGVPSVPVVVGVVPVAFVPVGVVVAPVAFVPVGVVVLPFVVVVELAGGGAVCAETGGRPPGVTTMLAPVTKSALSHKVMS